MPDPTNNPQVAALQAEQANKSTMDKPSASEPLPAPTETAPTTAHPDDTVSAPKHQIKDPSADQSTKSKTTEADDEDDELRNKPRKDHETTTAEIKATQAKALAGTHEVEKEGEGLREKGEDPTPTPSTGTKPDAKSDARKEDDGEADVNKEPRKDHEATTTQIKATQEKALAGTHKAEKEGEALRREEERGEAKGEHTGGADGGSLDHQASPGSSEHAGEGNEKLSLMDKVKAKLHK